MEHKLKLFPHILVKVHPVIGIEPTKGNRCYTGKKKKSGKGAKLEVTDNTRNKEDFEAMKRKTKGILIGMIAAVVAAVAGLVIYKATR